MAECIRARLRLWWPQGRVGSTPTVGTREKENGERMQTEENLIATERMVNKIQPKPLSGAVLRKQGRINTYNFPFTMNPTTGCLFGCRYCYLKIPPFSNYTEFGKEMIYRTDYITKLKRELTKYRDLPQHLKRVQIGAACEVYHPVVLKHIQKNETDFSDISIMSNILSVFIEEQNTHNSIWAIHIVTKSNLILDDIDLLKDLNCVQAEITLTTLDEAAKTVWEGSSPSVKVRLNTIEKLSSEGIFTRVMAMPLFVNPERAKELEHKYAGKEEEYADALERERWKSAGEIWSEAEKLGARAFKGKGLNYFTPELLLKGEMRRIKGRDEDPNKEKLVNSGENVLNKNGTPKTRTVSTWESRWVLNKDGTPQRTAKGDIKKKIVDFKAKRKVMNFGYRLIPKVKRLAWGDCT